MRILIIEDEFNLADAIKSRLEEDYIVDIETDGLNGYYKALENNHDLIILDIMLPNMDGVSILNELRCNNIDSKIIMLTAKSMIEDKLTCFKDGANDYLTKPFHIDELIARINVQLNNFSQKIKYKDLELDIKSSKLICTKNNEEVELVCKEFKLLEYFMNNNEQILSKEQIYDKVWGMDNEIESNNLEVYLTFIRRKLKAIGTVVNIKSVRGLGYKMEG